LSKQCSQLPCKRLRNVRKDVGDLATGCQEEDALKSARDVLRIKFFTRWWLYKLKNASLKLKSRGEDKTDRAKKVSLLYS
jgi:hypothetical protein